MNGTQMGGRPIRLSWGKSQAKAVKQAAAMGAIIDRTEKINLSSSTSSSRPPPPSKEESQHPVGPSLISPSSVQRVLQHPIEPSPTSSFYHSTTADPSPFSDLRHSDLRSSTSSNPSSSTGRPFDPPSNTFILDRGRSMPSSSLSGPSSTLTGISINPNRLQQEPPALSRHGSMRGVPVSVFPPPTSIPGMTTGGGISLDQSRAFPDAGGHHMPLLQQYPAMGERVFPSAPDRASGVGDSSSEMEFRGSSLRSEYVQLPTGRPPPSPPTAGSRYRDTSEFGVNVSAFGRDIPPYIRMSQPQQHLFRDQYGVSQNSGSNQLQPALGALFDGSMSFPQPVGAYTGYGSSALRADDDVPISPLHSTRDQPNRVLHSDSRRGRH